MQTTDELVWVLNMGLAKLEHALKPSELGLRRIMFTVFASVTEHELKWSGFLPDGIAHNRQIFLPPIDTC